MIFTSFEKSSEIFGSVWKSLEICEFDWKSKMFTGVQKYRG